MNNRKNLLVSIAAIVVLCCLSVQCTQQMLDLPNMESHPDVPVLYASPVGRIQGSGTRDDPVDLRTGLSHVRRDTVLELLGGIYRIPNGSILYLGGLGSPRSIIRAASGERPIITGENDFPPYVYLQKSTRVEGIWFGGIADSANTPFNMSNDDEIVGCVFWGYYGCIGDASKHNVYERNLFVNCGRGTLYHPIYITGRSTSWDSCTIVRRNVFVGGEGWAIHLWHGPTYVRVENNFLGNVSHCFASDGVPVIARDNVFWSHTAQPTILILGDMTLTHNLIGKNHTYYEYRDPAALSVAADRNSFIEPASPGGPFGTNPIRWDETGTGLRLGTGAPEIYNAISVLEGVFRQPAATLQTDPTPVQKWRVLLGALDSWSAH